ncbi:peptide deformylase [Mailhella massiliensis]|uniref:Peptide deformylase n=1 Tax=Mailhella massiliensis TaxID=1903261 RepID=A0A921AXP9_9BACT|nr:peptide deformylase [Mailhella massiliensis]HJD97777.1 peptide deformylase [Mailhella massiliensis]
MLRPVLQYPDPLLAKVSEPVAEINDEIRALAQDMLDTLTTVGGVGIAAPQIGVLKRVVIIDVSQEKNDPDLPQDFKVFVNPVITVLDPKGHEENEGCLSVPELRAKVKRPRRVALDALDLDGKPVHIEGEDYYGACMQHETDHLDGKLFIDHISYLKRSLYDKKMRKGRK